MTELRCSFCNKLQEEVRKLVAGTNGLICDECIKVAVGLMAGSPTPAPAETKNTSEPKAEADDGKAPTAMRILPSSE